MQVYIYIYTGGIYLFVAISVRYVSHVTSKSFTVAVTDTTYCLLQVWYLTNRMSHIANAWTAKTSYMIVQHTVDWVRFVYILQYRRVGIFHMYRGLLFAFFVVDFLPRQNKPANKCNSARPHMSPVGMGRVPWKFDPQLIFCNATVTASVKIQPCKKYPHACTVFFLMYLYLLLSCSDKHLTMLHIPLPFYYITMYEFARIVLTSSTELILDTLSYRLHL